MVDQIGPRGKELSERGEVDHSTTHRGPRNVECLREEARLDVLDQLGEPVDAHCPLAGLRKANSKGRRLAHQPVA